MFFCILFNDLTVYLLLLCSPVSNKKNHSKKHIIGDKNDGVGTRRQLSFNEQALLSILDPKFLKNLAKVMNGSNP